MKPAAQKPGTRIHLRKLSGGRAAPGGNADGPTPTAAAAAKATAFAPSPVPSPAGPSAPAPASTRPTRDPGQLHSEPATLREPEGGLGLRHRGVVIAVPHPALMASWAGGLTAAGSVMALLLFASVQSRRTGPVPGVSLASRLRA